MKAARYMRFATTALTAVLLTALVQPGAGSAATEPAQDAVRGYAEGLAEAATKEFSVVLERQRLAQAPTQTPKTDAGPSLKLDHTVGPPLSWFQRSRRDFQALMGMLAGGTPPTGSWDPVADAEKKAAARKPDTSQVTQPPPKAATAPVDAKKATEERRLAETRRSEPDPKAAADAKVAADAKKAADAKAGR